MPLRLEWIIGTIIIGTATEVLQELLKGRGRKSVNWSTLIAALNDSGLSELARDVEEALES